MLVKSAGESKVDKNSFIILTQVHGRICISLTKKKSFQTQIYAAFSLISLKKSTNLTKLISSDSNFSRLLKALSTKALSTPFFDV